jgi:hypothetical protein
MPSPVNWYALCYRDLLFLMLALGRRAVLSQLISSSG